MSYNDVVILIPSHGLEDFPTELGEQPAASLLNAFAVAWHPLLLSTTRALPIWNRSDEPPDTRKGRLIFVPRACDDWIPRGWVDRARSDGAIVLSGLTDRDEMIQAALAPLSDQSVGSPHDSTFSAAAAQAFKFDSDGQVHVQIDDELVADFLALGTCYLQMELLTRRMHHFSNLDEVHLQREAVAAAEAALANDPNTARMHLRSCFETLTETRERFYPVDFYLIDLCLVIPRLADEHLIKLLADKRPTNILVTAQDLDVIAGTKPGVIKAIKESWNRDTAEVVGGEFQEVPSPVLPLESVLWDFQRGHAVFRKLFSRHPTTWGRQRYGLSTLLPQILKKFGYHSALHLMLDDGIYPDTEQRKIRWEGCDGTVLDALSRIPLAADSASSFLKFSTHMAQSMEDDPTAAVILIRWPKVKAPWLEDFRRMSKYSPALGRFVTLNDYFQRTDTPGRLSSFDSKEYLTPFLTQTVTRKETNPISRYMNHFLRRHRFDAACWQRTLAALLTEKPADNAIDEDIEQAVEDAGPDGSLETVEKIEQLLPEFVVDSEQQLARVILQHAGNHPGFLLVNTLSFPRIVSVALPEMESPPEIDGPIKAFQFDEIRRTVLVELPGSGYVWIPKVGSVQESGKKRQTKSPVAEHNLLRNEFFEVFINETTGGLQRIKSYGRSPNRLSQQLTFRFPYEQTIASGEGKEVETIKPYYAKMRCSSSHITCGGPTQGEIVTTGEIVDKINDQRLAGFRQTFRVYRHKPVLEIEIELEVDRMPNGDPWSNYYASRFAWNDSTASLTRSLLGGAQIVDSERFESPYYLEIADENRRTTILNLGLPFHRKTGLRMLDSILITEGETCHRFRFVVAIDQTYPMQAALDAMTPVSVIPTETGPPNVGNSGWFFHLDARNVQIIRITNLMSEPPNDLEPCGQYDKLNPAPGCGFAVRMMETEGRHKSVALRCYLMPTIARQRDFEGRTIGDLKIDGNCVHVEMTAYAIADIELRFDGLQDEKT